MNNPLTENYISYLNTWKNSIFRVDIHLIWWCNFKCIMCDNWKKKVELNFNYTDLQKYIIILKKYYNCDYIRFHWQEPSLYDKLEDLVLFTKKLWIKVWIKTNWRLINNKRLVNLISYWLDDLYLSIDSANADEHDKIRWIKWSFDKNIDLIKKWRTINPKLKIYVNSVIMKSNYNNLDKMLDLWFKYRLDRVSFVFLNDKNRKDIEKINLDKESFYDFFRKHIINIYKKSILYNISVDFSPFLASLSWKDNETVINELENNFSKYIPEVEAFYIWDYGKYFYDNYWCFWPLDHASINYNWDMFSCCVVERDSSNSVWNIINEDLQNLWDQEKYKNHRLNSDNLCTNYSKCASNFYTRKTLFKNIYLNDELYNKNNPLNYYRYLKEFQSENEDVRNKVKLDKLKSVLLYFYENLDFYKNILLNKWISKKEIENINSLDFINSLPFLDKDILIKNFEEINKLSIWKNRLSWKTSGTSWKRLDFIYPLDFKRYIKQIAIFSEEFWFTYKDYYFSLTPINCNQTIINSIKEPEYVKKIYLPTTNLLNFDKKYFSDIYETFIRNKNVKFLHWDSKYLLYIILWFKKYNLDLPILNWISLSYSYTNKSLKKIIETSFNCKIYDNYWCSEVWPISIDKNWSKEIFWDNLIIEEINWKSVITDLDNIFFPFIRYNNGDFGNIDWNKIEVLWKDSQTLNWKNLNEIDNFFYQNFQSILSYQFAWDKFNYISENNIDEQDLKTKLKKYFGIFIDVHNIWENDFLEMGECSKFKSII